jgi:hypothetical protein
VLPVAVLTCRQEADGGGRQSLLHGPRDSHEGTRSRTVATFFFFRSLFHSFSLFVYLFGIVSHVCRPVTTSLWTCMPLVSSRTFSSVATPHSTTIKVRRFIFIRCSFVRSC